MAELAVVTDEEEEVADPEDDNPDGDPADDADGPDDEESTIDTENGEVATNDAENPDGNGDGGSGDEDPDGESESVAVAPSGAALLELLKGDPEAQTLMASSLQSIMQENAKTAATKAEQDEYNALVEKGDFGEIGRRIVERSQEKQTHDQVAEQVLKDTFTPVYTELFAQPEMKILTAEEKEALDPKKFQSDAHYVRAVSSFIDGKRSNSAIEAEVTRRIAERDTAETNRKAAAKAGSKSISGSPAGSVATTPNTTSTARIAAGLRAAMLGPGADDDDDN